MQELVAFGKGVSGLALVGSNVPLLLRSLKTWPKIAPMSCVVLHRNRP